MKAATSAVITAIINTIGFASMVTFNAANAVFTAVITPEIFFVQAALYFPDQVSITYQRPSAAAYF